ncbi:MAG TPA: AI-2E family transporter [Mycobacteriales bacterium]|nr:AI-2E family transporter [Mycobacteriales bacterium]
MTTPPSDGAPVADPTRVEADQVTPTPEPHRRLPPSAHPREALVGTATARLATFSLRLLLISAAVLLVGVVLSRLWVIVLPVLLGLLLATVFWPPVRFLRRRGAPPALSAAAVLLAGVLLLTATVAVLAPQVTGQAQEIADQVVAGLDNLQELVTGPPLNLGQDVIGNAVDNVISSLQANAQNIAGRVLTGAVAAGSLLLTGLLAVVLCFFFLKDGPKFLPWLGGLVGPRAAPHVSAVGQRAWVTLSGFIRAQAAVGFVDAVAIGIGLAVLGVPLALPLAVLIFFGAFIPIIGAVVTGALAALVALVTNGVTSALVVVALVLIVQQLEGNVLQPVLVGRTLDLHPAVVILAVTAGGTLAGITGAFLAVPVVAVVAVVVRYVRQHLAQLEPLPGSPPAAAGQPTDQTGIRPPG